MRKYSHNATGTVSTVVPVVVLAYGYSAQGFAPGYGPLGVARSLGRLGVPMYVIRDRALAPMPVSRFWKEAFTWDPAASDDQTVRFVLDIGRRLGPRPILFYTTDGAARFVSQHASALEDVFTFPKVSLAVVESLIDKSCMFHLAKEKGIATPEMMFPRSRGDVSKFLDTARFPVMLKGADPLLPHGRTKDIVNNARELLEKYDRVANAGAPNLMLQEYIPGDEDSVWMCNAYFDRNSTCLAAFTGQKIRQWPPYTGVASMAVCQSNPTVEEATRRFMQAIGYQGLVGIGYKYDARDGRYKVLDVNPRVSAVFRLFVTKNNMDPVRVCYFDLTGQAMPPLALTVGRKWLLEEDLYSMLKYRGDGKLTFGQWLRSLRGVQETAWFAADDPLPFLVWCWRRLAQVPAKFLRNSSGGE